MNRFRLLAFGLGMAANMSMAASAVLDENFEGAADGWSGLGGFQGSGFQYSNSPFVFGGSPLETPAMDLGKTPAPVLALVADLGEKGAGADLTVASRNGAQAGWSDVEVVHSAGAGFQHYFVHLPAPSSEYQVRLGTNAASVPVDNVVVGDAATAFINGVHVGEYMSWDPARTTFAIDQGDGVQPASIEVGLPYRMQNGAVTDISALTPVFSGLYSTVTPTGPVDFSHGPVTFVATSPDGSSTRNYVVDVKVHNVNTGALLSNIGALDNSDHQNSVVGTIVQPTQSGEHGTVTFTLPYGKNLPSNLTPRHIQFSEGARASVAGDVWTWDFTGGKTYQLTIASEDGAHQTTYDVRAEITPVSVVAHVASMEFCPSDGSRCTSATTIVDPVAGANGQVRFDVPNTNPDQFESISATYSVGATGVLSLTPPYIIAAQDTFQVTVTAQDGVHQGVYDVIVAMGPPSSDATLYGVEMATAGGVALPVKAIRAPASSADTGSIEVEVVSGTDISAVVLGSVKTDWVATWHAVPAVGPYDLAKTLLVAVTAPDSSATNLYRVVVDVVAPAITPSLPQPTVPSSWWMDLQGRELSLNSSSVALRQMQIVNGAGRVVRTQALDGTQALVDLHDLPAGQYVVKATLRDRSQVVRPLSLR